MKYLKHAVLTFGLATIISSLSSCAGGKESIYSFEEEPPFKVENAYFQKWVAGIQSGGSGMNVHLIILDIQEGVEIQEVYFRNNIKEARSNFQTPDWFVIEYKNNGTPDIIMDGDAINEAKNTPPREFPFNLDPNDAVLSYKYKGETYFVKISNMEEKPLLAYPGQKPDQDQ